MKLLFVCTGNTCRSPMAQAIYRAMGGEAESAGLQVSEAAPACENAKKAVIKYGGDLSEHYARSITTKMVEDADAVVTMTSWHRDFVKYITPDTDVMTLAEFAGEMGDVADPFGGDESIYERCAAQIYSYLKKGLERRTVIRTAHINDADFVAQCERDVFDDAWSISAVSGAIERGQVIVAENGGEKSGYCIFMNAADEGEILRIAVDEKMRGHGIGKALLEDAIKKMRAGGAEKIYLEVRKSNQAAILLYKAAGFKETGSRPKYYSDGEDALVFSCI